MNTSTEEPNKNTVPAISKALLRYMNDLWPEKTPTRGATLEDIHISIGHREVLRKLNTEYEQQNKTILTNT